VTTRYQGCKQKKCDGLWPNSSPPHEGVLKAVLIGRITGAWAWAMTAGYFNLGDLFEFQGAKMSSDAGAVT